MTLASVSVNFMVVLPQGHNAEDMEQHLSAVLTKALLNEPSVVEFNVLPGTRTSVDPFTPADVLGYTVKNPKPLALR
jgi:hypothetical protein